jgi:hypothetical protein
MRLSKAKRPVYVACISLPPTQDSAPEGAFLGLGQLSFSKEDESGSGGLFILFYVWVGAASP